jgi:hypothetical protein
VAPGPRVPAVPLAVRQARDPPRISPSRVADRRLRQYPGQHEARKGRASLGMGRSE